MIEREELASRVNEIMETCLPYASLGDNREKIFKEFYNKLTEPQNFKEEGGIFVPNTKGKINLNMTQEHINPYFKVLTKKLIDYKELVKTNEMKCKNYKTPQLEVITASRLAKEAFYESFLAVKDSYKQDENNKLANSKNDLFEICNKGLKGEGKKVVELTPEDADRLKNLQELHLY